MIIGEKIIEKINYRTKGDFKPFYIYDSQSIRQICQKFHKIPYKNKAIHFATMANINHDFLNVIKKEKINVFVNSLLHLKAVRKAGFNKSEIIFTSSGLNKTTMKKIIKTGVQLNLDSPSQLAQFQELFPDKKVGIRCNIGDKVKPYSTRAGFFIGSKSRLGFTIEEIEKIENKEIIKGLHLYVGTDIFDIEYFVNCYNELIELSAKFPNLKYLNFGGGFGVSENGEKQFDFDNYSKNVSKLMQEVNKNRENSLKLILEPGRIIGSQAGYFVCAVSDIKKRNQTLIGVSASTAQFSRPLLYPESANHPAMIIRDGKQLFDSNTQKSTIYGSSTYSRDIFCQDRQLPELKIGDIVVFGNGGSYSASSHSEFLGFKKAEEIFIR